MIEHACIDYLEIASQSNNQEDQIRKLSKEISNLKKDLILLIS
jgi:hypothetical protein